jgi:NHL repeat
LDAPAKLEVAANGDVYVADSGNGRISVFGGDGRFLRTFGEGVLVDPRDVALAVDGRVFVADPGIDLVAVFSATGAHVDDVDSAGLIDPIAVALAGSTLFVAEGSDDSVVVYEDDGELVGPFTTPAVPRDVIVGLDDNPHVLLEDRVEVFTSAGTPVRSYGSATQLGGAAALASDPGGQVFVADQGDAAIERFDAAGFYLGGVPAGPGPVAVASACAGNLFVVQAALARVERFGEPGTPSPPCAAPSGEPVQVSLVPLPSNRMRFAGLVKNRRNGSAVLFVRVAGPGRVILKGRGVRRLARGAPRAKVVRLPVKPKVRLKRFLKKHGKGRIRVEAIFRPVGGEPRAIEKVIVLRRRR